MEPITAILTAVAAGAAAAAKDTAGQVVKDGYTALKTLIVRKFEGKGAVAPALDGLEKKPDSESWKTALGEELTEAGAGHDAELLQQAEKLLALLRKHGLGPASGPHAEVRGDGAIAQGTGAVAAGKGGVAIGGSVQNSEITTGESTGKSGKSDELPEKERGQ
jgi:hypothetical protein